MSTRTAPASLRQRRPKRNRACAQAQDAASEWQATFDSVTDIVALISPDFRLLRINKAGGQALGRKPEELIGRKCYEVVHGLNSPIAGCPCAETLRTGKAGVGEITQGGRYFRATAAPVWGRNRKLVAFSHTIANVGTVPIFPHPTPTRQSGVNVKTLRVLYRPLPLWERMNMIRHTALVIALFGLLATGVAEPLTVGLEADFASRYVWRGIALSDGPVLQPSAWVSFAGLTLTPWANIAFSDGDAPAGLNELDLTLDYSRDVLGLTVDPSFSVYLYPNQIDAAPTGELALALSYPVGPVSIYSNHSVDLIATPGAYFGDAGLCFETELTGNLGLEASACVGWASARFNDANFEVNRAALNVVCADLALNWSPGGWFYLRPHAALSVILDRDLRAAVTNPLLVTGGLAIGREF